MYKEPNAREYAEMMQNANQAISTDGFDCVHNNVGWSGYTITTPKGSKYQLVRKTDRSSDGYFLCEYTSKPFSTGMSLGLDFENLEMCKRYLFALETDPEKVQDTSVNESREYVMLKAKDLKVILENVDDNASVYVGCEGYTNYTSDNAQKCDTRAFMSNGMLFITDACKLDGIDEDEPVATNLQLGLEMLLDIQFNREIKKTDYINVGSITLEIDGEDIQFDFERTVTIKDLKDKTVQKFYNETLDFETFPDCYKLNYTGLNNITKIKEIFIQLDSEDENDLITPVEVKTMTFITTYNSLDETKWTTFAVKEDVLKDAVFYTDGV